MCMSPLSDLQKINCRGFVPSALKRKIELKTYITAFILVASYSDLSLAQSSPLGPAELALTCKFGATLQQVRGPKFSTIPLTLVMQDPTGFRAMASVVFDGKSHITDGYIVRNSNSVLPSLVNFNSSRASRFYLNGENSPYFGCSRDPL